MKMESLSVIIVFMKLPQHSVLQACSDARG